ncbi:MAG: hypothetical protein ABJB66_17765 [Gemmatimonadaceae bacterium]
MKMQKLFRKFVPLALLFVIACSGTQESAKPDAPKGNAVSPNAVAPNDNQHSVGALKDGVLTVSLDANRRLASRR